HSCSVGWQGERTHRGHLRGVAAPVAPELGLREAHGRLATVNQGGDDVPRVDNDFRASVEARVLEAVVRRRDDEGVELRERLRSAGYRREPQVVLARLV